MFQFVQPGTGAPPVADDRQPPDHRRHQGGTRPFPLQPCVPALLRG